MNNRSFNTKKIKIFAKTHRVFTSKHKNQFFMFEDFVDLFYQKAKSSFIRFIFFKLITKISDLFRSSRNTKNRFSTRRIVKNLESHDSMSENFKKKQKTKMNLLKEFVKSNNRSKNRATYNKTSYNRDVVTILLIVNKKKYNLSIFQQKFTSKVVAIVRSLYNLMSKSKKIQYLAQTQKLLNS
jgi:chlorite dismutase